MLLLQPAGEQRCCLLHGKHASTTLRAAEVLQTPSVHLNPAYCNLSAAGAPLQGGRSVQDQQQREGGLAGCFSVRTRYHFQI
jgi:hypothetical protein